MALTRDFRETVWTSAQQDRTFYEALLSEALDTMFAGDVTTGKE